MIWIFFFCIESERFDCASYSNFPLLSVMTNSTRGVKPRPIAFQPSPPLSCDHASRERLACHLAAVASSSEWSLVCVRVLSWGTRLGVNCSVIVMLLGTMQQDGHGAAMLVVPIVKTRATDFSIAAIMARGPRGEGRSTCRAAAHNIPSLGKLNIILQFSI